MKLILRACLLVLGALTCVGPIMAGAPPRIEWVATLEADGDVGISGLAIDPDGNFYVTGNTRGQFGETYFGSSDAYIAKYDALGTRLWVHQTGGSGRESGNAIAWNSGSIYVSGDWESWEYYVTKYSPDGVVAWHRNPQVGHQSNGVEKIAFDSGGDFYLCGMWPDLTKFNAEGEVVWTDSLTFIDDCAVDENGNLFVGYWDATAPQTYLSKLRPDRTVAWATPLLTTELAVFEDTVYVATKGISPTIGRYDTEGQLIWSAPFPNSTNDIREVSVRDIVVDEQGGVYVGGQTRGYDNLLDMVIHKYSPSGDLIWEWYGDGITDGEAFVTSLALGGDGRLYVGGRAEDVGAVAAHGVLFAMVPEPSGWALAAAGCLAIGVWRRRWSRIVTRSALRLAGR